MKVILEFDDELNLIKIEQDTIPSWVDDSEPVRNVYGEFGDE